MKGKVGGERGREKSIKKRIGVTRRVGRWGWMRFLYRSSFVVIVSVRVRSLVGTGRRRPRRRRGRVHVVRLVGHGVRVHGGEVVQLRLQIVVNRRGEEARGGLLLLLLLLVVVKRRHGGRGRAHRGRSRGHRRKCRVRVHQRRMTDGGGQLIRRTHLKRDGTTVGIQNSRKRVRRRRADALLSRVYTQQ